MKAILDSSVLISAFLTRGGSPGQVLAAGLDGRFEIVLSEPILTEIARSLQDKPSLTRRYGFTEAEAEAVRFVADLAAAVTVLGELRAIEPVCRDPADDHVLAASLTAGADYIVTGDRDLLALVGYRGALIIQPGPFLELVNKY